MVTKEETPKLFDSNHNQIEIRYSNDDNHYFKRRKIFKEMEEIQDHDKEKAAIEINNCVTIYNIENYLKFGYDPISLQPAEYSTKRNFMITDKPSGSSKGFENTFRLLQRQINLNKQKTINLLNVLNLDNELLSSFKYHPLVVGAEKLSCLELEVAAMHRIKFIDKVVDQSSKFGENKKLNTPLLTLLYKFASRNFSYDFLNTIEHSILAEIINHDIQYNSNLMYHVGKNANGSKCLKILCNLLKRKEVLCGNRVSHMTRAYDDIEAVTRLLEEKEKDLELTVQIGKELLAQNNVLENRLVELEAEIKAINEERAQLVHELHKKNGLIAVLTKDGEDATDDDSPTDCKSITLDLLKKKITILQNENKSLKLEASQLACQTDEIEAHERMLMDDISAQLNDANKQYEGLYLDLERHREENRLQHEKIISLSSRLSEAEMKLNQVTHDNDEHITLLNITKENQNSLALELAEFKERYQEVLALLQETQEQLRKQRKKTMPQARNPFAFTVGIMQPDSLQSELMESSLFSENSIDSGFSGDNQHINDRIGRSMSTLVARSSHCGNNSLNSANTCALGEKLLPPYNKIFHTVRCVKKSGNIAGSDIDCAMHVGTVSINASEPRISARPFISGEKKKKSSFCDGSLALGICMKTSSCESINSELDDGYPSLPSGVPGAPGAKELEAALKRLTPAEVLARRAMLSYAPAGTYSYDDQQPISELPLGIQTPDSIMSIESSGISSSTNMSLLMHQWRLPDKLQIVKPIEGSQTLHHWTRLATPTLSGLLEERPGVTIRGGRCLDDLGMQIYTLSDIEEDISDELPGKQFEFSGCTYTYTTSTVMHPDDGLINDLSFLSQSQMSSRIASTSTSRQPSCPPTPRAGLSRKNSCSTFSVNLGLASMLNERGIKAVTPSALNTPAGLNFSPTVTPCNSPDGSPIRSISPEPLFGLISSGADLIKRKLVGEHIERPDKNQLCQKQQKIILTRLERRALRSLRLVEKVERIGLENIISTQPNAMSQFTSGIVNRSVSPIGHLTSIKNIQTNDIVNDIRFDRNQIKDVLQKGLHTEDQKNLTSIGATKNWKSTTDHRDSEISMIDTKVQQTLRTLDEKAQCATSANIEHSNIRLTQIQRQKSRRNLNNCQRPDLGTIGCRVRKDLGHVSGKLDVPQLNIPSTVETGISGSSKVITTKDIYRDAKETHHQSITQSFVGTVSSLLFGRKGGWF